MSQREFDKACTKTCNLSGLAAQAALATGTQALPPPTALGPAAAASSGGPLVGLPSPSPCSTEEGAKEEEEGRGADWGDGVDPDL